MGRLERGDWVGGYQIVGQHWDGGLGEAWVAKSDAPDAAGPALVMVRALADVDDETRGRLLAWGATLSRLEVEGVARVHDVTERDGDVLLVTELVPGESLRQVGRAVRRWPLGLAVRMVAELGRQLDLLYDREDDDESSSRVTHGALDASRVFLDYETFRLVVVDPGLQGALARGRGASRGEDVLGLARILYELVTGQPCPEGKVPSLRSQGLKSPRKLEAAMKCATAMDARKRYATPSGFVRDLEECLSEAARAGALEDRVQDYARTKLQNRLQGTRTLVARWAEAPSPRLPSRPSRAGPRSGRHAPVSAPRLPKSAARRFPRSSPRVEPPPSPPEPAVEASARAFVEPIFDDVTPPASGLAVIAPIPHPDHVAAQTDDLQPLLEPEPAPAGPRPEVIRLLRQLTLLGLLATVALAGWAYLSTEHAQGALDVMWVWLGAR